MKNEQKNKMELLAPAGDLPTAKDVILRGADAVYFGGEAFGARAYAKNFSYEESEELVRFAHLRGRKVYLTFNTLLKNREMEEEAYGALKRYYEMGVDAVIFQDYGLLSILKECFPGMEPHASTQMNITSSFGALYLKGRGASRVVLGRELSIEEIARIRRISGVEVEVFLHGALCVCYSGQCLMSSMIGGRSGNRGRCAQPCRQPYRLTLDGKPVRTDGEYLLSPKDLCGAKAIGALYRAGVSSLKIEGRMKSREYAGAVVSVYRGLLDQVFEAGGADVEVSQKQMQRLSDAGSRSGFTDLYFSKRNGKGLMSQRSPKHSSADYKLPGPVEEKQALSGVLTVRAGERLSLEIDLDGKKLREEGPYCEPAKKRATSEEEIKEKLLKTGELPFDFSAVAVDTDEDAFVPMKELNALRRRAAERVAEELICCDLKRRDNARPLPRFDGPSDRALPFKTLARVHTAEQLAACEKSGRIDAVITEALSAEELLTAVPDDMTVIYALPTVVRENVTDALDTFVRSHPDAYYEADGYDALGYLLKKGIPADRIFGGTRLYAWSDRTRAAFAEEGIACMSVPPELSAKELFHRSNRLDRILVYGRLPLMLTANCLRKNARGCTKKNGMGSITDKKKMTFPVRFDCASCTNIIYNSLPTFLSDEKELLAGIGAGAAEFSFLDEEADEVLRILNGGSPKGKTTRGHLKRGVE